MPHEPYPDRRLIITYVQREWIKPARPLSQKSREEEYPELDEEDLARIRLIQDLQESFGVNDESIPIILNLVDQIHLLRFLMDQTMKKGA
jgi:chaperone modulatory protein CbpM